MLLLLLITAAAAVVAGSFTGVATLPQQRKAHARAATLLESSSLASSSLPDLNYGLSDEEFHDWLMEEVDDCPGRKTYSSVYEDSVKAIVQWRKRYRGNPLLWKRIFKKERVVKELIESAPIIESVKRFVESNNRESDEKITVIDLCSGKGYLSMFLSEILPEEKVERFVLVDKAWAIASNKTLELKPHHMNWDHIYGLNPRTDESYFLTWPILLYTSKQDLKQSCNQRQMKKHLFEKTAGPIILLAVHLCGTLSIKAVDMFNNNNNVKLFALKPCCLPQMVYARRGDVFRIGNHEFDAKEVCSNGSFNKKSWDGPPRWHLQPKFDLWAENLFMGIDVANSEEPITTGRRATIASDDGSKAKEEIIIQVDGGFQNTYIFAERQPVTRELWDI
mmetsp:Transcript_38979/g.83190  ORF Transcript_38979/g.83190 Transcript_38979/m.83190 type:complete len:392 (+) Transcript_38979:223-1398(+)|eukprot:CAMPEP_0172567562 /NCGR_PEP_ID=MMETSP1067-20121228/116307_1 /TAXON_ID=265564 ORGANISM="Thalassiosira punctigera, Strain Tpunct2005C2" /NCGR_SAMPLE_ID=MMETSP1067 /ASSEMBLY_ACC=CAM_ASM_000444 /LENGTH=391 /DNA_ID=CAMNT_0013358935 /DNA_START=133 /DNA_END=1308 /DNA_ORIENTATION=-